MLSELYSYDKESNRTAMYDARPGAAQHRSYEYDYNGLDRLTEAVRGDGVKTGFTAIGGGEQWDLDMLGNWDERITDTSLFWGVIDGSDTNQPRDHNGVNELTAIDPSGDNLGLDYDDAGNLRQQDKTSNTAHRYTHDAWNRLVKVELVINPGGSEVVLDYGEYEYNGLHQRTIRRADTDLNGALDQQRCMYYDASWRLCEEQIWDDWDSEEDETDIDRHIHYTWGPRYIDDIAFRRVDNNGDEDYSDAGDEIYYHLTDAQFSTKTVIDSTAAIVEWVEYKPYGEASHHHKYDMDNDRDFDSTDRSIIGTLADIGGFPSDPTDIDETGYRSEADINRDGTIDINDHNAVGTNYATAISGGLISTDEIDNIVGYDGYLFNAETRQYHVRYRVYDPGLGRWIERDPLDYVDSLNMNQFARSSPTNNTDQFGLCCAPSNAPTSNLRIIVPNSNFPKSLTAAQRRLKACEASIRNCIKNSARLQAEIRRAAQACSDAWQGGRWPGGLIEIQCIDGLGADGRTKHHESFLGINRKRIRVLIESDRSRSTASICTTLIHEFIHVRQMCERWDWIDEYVDDKYHAVCSELEAWKTDPIHCKTKKLIEEHPDGSKARQNARNRWLTMLCQDACRSAKSQWDGDEAACLKWCKNNYDNCSEDGEYKPPNQQE